MGLAPWQTGTRNSPTQSTNSNPTRSIAESFSADPGMSKNVQGISATFVGSPTNQIHAANGTFAPFKVDDLVMVEGSGATPDGGNDGVYLVLGIDAVNQSYLKVAGCRSQGPVTVSIRTT